MALLTVGSLALDNIETPLGKRDGIIGGAAPFICLAGAQFVKPVRLVGVIGDDFPQTMLDKFVKEGVDLEGLQKKEGQKSFSWTGKYHEDMNGRDTIATDLNVLGDFDPIVPENFRDSEFVMLGNLQPSVQAKVIDQLTQPKLIALDTMNFWMDIALDELKAVIKRIDVLLINDEEARQLSGERTLVMAAKHILKMGPKFLVIKKGEHGALLFHGEDNMFLAPALPLAKVFDPTGAGDTFAGGFMGYMASAKEISFETMKSAVIYGSALASFTCEAFGIERLQTVTKEELTTRTQKFADLTKFSL
jgi:sugar/nucleoside kinase (ribokinase family)